MRPTLGFEDGNPVGVVAVLPSECMLSGGLGIECFMVNNMNGFP